MAKAICVSKAHLLPILTLLSPDTVASLHFPCLSASLPQPHHPAHPPVSPSALCTIRTWEVLHHTLLPLWALTGGGCLCPGLPHICVVFGA